MTQPLTAQEKLKRLTRIAVAADDYLRFRADEQWEAHYADMLDYALDDLGRPLIDEWRKELELEDDD